MRVRHVLAAVTVVVLIATIAWLANVRSGRPARGVVRTAGRAVGGAKLRFTHGHEAVDAHADAHGAFSVKLRDVAYTVTARAPGYAPAVIEGVRAGELPDLWLDPARVLRGRAVGEDGRPIGGVAVTVTGGDPSWAAKAEATARTAADGSFTVRDAPSTAPSVELRAHGYAPAQTDVPDSGSLTAVLRRTAAITGRVAAADGRPAPGAAVTGGNARSRTDAHGGFTLNGVAPGAVEVTASAPGRTGAAFVTVAPGGRAQASVTLGSTGRIDGTVVDTTGNPVAGAMVRLLPADALSGPVAEDAVGTPMFTDAGGRFRFDDVPPGTLAVVAGARTFLPTVPMQVTVRPGRAATVRIGLWPTAGVTGRVVDAVGRPMPYATVSPRSGPETDWFGQRAVLVPGSFQQTATTSANGEFFLSSAPGDKVELVATCPGYAAGVSGPLRLGDGRSRHNVTIRLGPGRTLRGTVTDPAGHPVAGAKVIAHPPDSAPAPADPPDDPVAVSGADGSFAIAGLADAAYTVEASAAGYGTTTAEDVRPGRRPTLKLSPGQTATGVVVDDIGRPVAGAQVTVDEPAGGTHNGSTDWQGRFAIPDVTAGTELFVEALADGHSAGTTTMHGAPARLRLARSGTLRGRVTDEAGRPVPAFTATLLPPVATPGSGPVPQQESHSFASGDGNFAWAGLPAGTWTFAVSAPGLRPRTARITIPPGGAGPTTNFHLAAGTVLRGRVMDDTGRPVAGAVLAPETQGFTPATTDADGGFVLDGMPSKGGVRLSITTQDGRSTACDAVTGKYTTIKIGD